MDALCCVRRDVGVFVVVCVWCVFKACLVCGVFFVCVCVDLRVLCFLWDCVVMVLFACLGGLGLWACVC